MCQVLEEVPHTYDDTMTDPTPTGCVCGDGGKEAKQEGFQH